MAGVLGSEWLRYWGQSGWGIGVRVAEVLGPEWLGYWGQSG